MSKNYIKMLGLSLASGYIIGKIYELGIKEGKERLALDMANTINAAFEDVEKN